MPDISETKMHLLASRPATLKKQTKKKMKKLYYICMVGLLLSAMMLGFSGCSDDDGPGSSTDLIGTWQSVSISGWDKEDGEIVDEWDEEDSDIKIVFNEDGTYEHYERWSNSWHGGYVGTWKYKGGKIYVYDEEDEEWDDEISTVKSLSSSQLVLDYYEKYTEDGVRYEYYVSEIYRKISD